MNERDWHILKVLHEHRNITKTAQSLYISQPSLTKRIQQIEKEFNLKIVERGTRGCSSPLKVNIWPSVRMRC